MAKNYFRRYIWLIELINRKGYISFREISDAWSRSPLNETGAPLSERTFFNHKDAIFDTFGIEILNDRSLGFYIGHSDVGNDETADWMLHTLCMNNLLQENSDMRDRILVDRVPSSEKFLTNVISAMRDSKTIMLYYQSFRHPEPHGFNVRPTASSFSSKDGICWETATWACGCTRWTALWTWRSWTSATNCRRASMRKATSVTISVSSSGRNL